MSTSVHGGGQAEVWAAVSSALILHLLLFLGVAVSFAVIESRPSTETVEAVTEADQALEIFVEQVVPELPPEAEPTPPPTEEKKVMEAPRVVRTSPEQEQAIPQTETNLIGERDTQARSDAAPSGAEDRPAFAGLEEKGAPQSVDSSFSKGEDIAASTDPGPGSQSRNQTAQAASPQQATEKSVPTPQSSEPQAEGKKVAEAQPPPEPDFLKPDFAEEQAARLASQKEYEKKLAEEQKRREAEEARLARQEAEQERERLQKERERKEQARREQQEREEMIAGGQESQFRSQTRKTVVSGSISARGVAAQNVKNTPLGRYQMQLFREIEKRWQEGNFRHRSHIVPGMINTRFLIDQQGKISGQRRLEMQGASQMQWGLILNALDAVEMPPMPKAARSELGGHPLELSVMFSY